MNEQFLEELAKLNDEQRAAVEAIDGPVMVLAGPGTGKTQLLAMRVANILQKTDANPGNILCLTFTDAASENMTERMARLFGAEAYNVAVHTFHSLATNAMARFGEYFFDGAKFTPADEITKLEILNDILRKLPHDNILSGTFDDTSNYLDEVQKAISNIKRRGGVTPDELRVKMARNLEFIKFAEPILVDGFSVSFSRKKAEMPDNIARCQKMYNALAKYPDKEFDLVQITLGDFEDAINSANTAGKTTALTAFRNKYLNIKKGQMLDHKKTLKTQTVADVYEKYESEMQKRKLIDFDDMIVQMVEKLENDADFRADLQEQYQYILVDEFQDTNLAQMRIINAIANTPDSNIMVVGDDDQAIFSFQGANSNNLIEFNKHYPGAKAIQLFQNYRSEKEILQLAEQVISESSVRIKKTFFQDLHDLSAEKIPESPVNISFNLANTAIDERAWIAEKIASEKDECAVIARSHKDLISLIPYLFANGIHNIAYENNQNVLDSEPVVALENLSRIVAYLGVGDNRKANILLPELLANDAWKIPAKTIWKLSLETEYNGLWLEKMLENDELKEIADWLIEMAKKAQNQNLETMLDELFNKVYKDAYFSAEKLSENPEQYVEYLTDLSTLRDAVRAYSGDETPNLQTFIAILDDHRKHKKDITAIRKVGENARVHLMTAHKSKGQEFDTVFVINGTKKSWLEIHNDYFFPSNLHLTIPGDLDENIRLLFVAITRARRQLFITTHEFDTESKKILNILPFLGEIEQKTIETGASEILKNELNWRGKYTKVDTDLRTILAPKLANYKLNATAVGSFTNLEYAGPENFLLNNLLHFPHAKKASEDFGTAIHETMKFAHNEFNKTGKKPVFAKITEIFTETLRTFHLDQDKFDFYKQKGCEALEIYLDFAEFNQNQKPEYPLTAKCGEMTLTGNLDLIEIDDENRVVTVVDYKTGSNFEEFNKEKIKSHTYYQQLQFYKLLIQNSGEKFANYEIRGILHFIEPVDGEIKTLEIDYGDVDFAKFNTLCEIIWQKIQNLDFPKVEQYPKNLKGTLQFEDDLLSVV